MREVRGVTNLPEKQPKASTDKFERKQLDELVSLKVRNPVAETVAEMVAPPVAETVAPVVVAPPLSIPLGMEDKEE